MKLQTVLSSLCLLALSAHAAPSKRSDPPPTDIQILNYALTLEHLENAFYSGALAKFDDAAFSKANLNRALFEQIASHEAAHVKFLTTALGDQATKPCNYSFPYTDPTSFSALSAVLEGVGVSAYLGAAALIQNKDYLTAAGAILTTESRHAAWVSSSENNNLPWSGPFDTPLGLNDVYSLAAPFITSCPSTNPALPVKAFPALNVTGGAGSINPGSTISVTFANATTAAGSGQLFLAFFSGLSTTFAPYDASKNTVTVPAGLAGTVYAVATSVSNGTVTDDNTLAGPIILSNVGGSGNAGGGAGGSGHSSPSNSASTTGSASNSTNGALGMGAPLTGVAVSLAGLLAALAF
ncbi:hypothetical protein BOTBODRAFT_183530 [Botryobasidium botryosum FD-172 SS1]|uniref:Ferritin-like domain-containing protein n=1 Tax=Botryobasidium botryosum (strain FD-172 SS1) TaxID=930990 RepID=A0A067MYX6_BOTB1|nr:hypothetical protein BOTBODRAFT_183530 [Botryobasidium botryosum FD-172 SS1]